MEKLWKEIPGTDGKYLISTDGEVMAMSRRATGINNDSISRVCKGKSKTVGGYRWRYLNE